MASRRKVTEDRPPYKRPRYAPLARASEDLDETGTDEDKDILKQARARWAQSDSKDSKQRTRERDDLSYYQGDTQWPENARMMRSGEAAQGIPATPARPTLVFNKVREPVKQIGAEQASADLAFELVPADDFGHPSPITEAEIELREGLVRRIQRESHAQDARAWAANRAAIAGRGYYRLTTKYVDVYDPAAPPTVAMLDQDIVIDRIFDGSAVRIDPLHEQPDASDADWSFVVSRRSFRDLEAEYPDKMTRYAGLSDNAWSELASDAPDWYGDGDDSDDDTTNDDVRSLQVADYYRIVPKGRTLVHLTDGGVAWQDQLPEGASVRAEGRRIVTRTCEWIKMTGHCVLDRTEWPAPWQPVLQILGDALQPFDTEKRVEGVVRSARDAQTALNYVGSKAVEMIGWTPIPPLMVADGQIDDWLAWYQQANVRAVPVLFYKTKDRDGNVVGPPSRPNIDTNLAPIMSGFAMLDQMIKATTGVPDPMMGNVDPSLKSGKAIQAVVEQGKRTTGVYTENYVRTMTHEGRMINWLLPTIYGRKDRLLRMMTPRGEAQQVSLGTAPQQQTGPSSGGQPDPGVYTLTPGASFNVAVKVSKNRETRQQQEAAILGELATARPELLSVFGDELFDNLESLPGHRELAQRMRVMLDPRVLALISGQTPPPPELMARIEQAEGLANAVQQENAQLKAVIGSKQVEKQADLARAEMDNATKIEIAKIDAGTKLTIADLQATVKQATEALRIQAEQMRTIVEQAQEVRLSQHEAGHAHGLQADQHDHERRESDKAHEQAKETIALTPSPTSSPE